MRPALFLLLAAILCALNAPAQDAPAPPAAPPQSAPPVAATPPAAPVTTTPVQTPSAQATPASPPAVPSPSATDDKELTRLEEKINRLEDKRIDEATANVERNANWVVGWTQIGLAILGILAAVLSIGVGMIGKWAKEQVKAAQEQTSSMMKAVAEAEKQVQDATDALKKAQEQTADTMKAVVEAKQQLEEARNTRKEAQDLGSQVKLMHKASLEQPPTPATIRAATAVADNEDAEMPDRLMAKALMYQSKKMWKEAAAKWQELVDLQPDNIRARFGAAATMGRLAACGKRLN